MQVFQGAGHLAHYSSEGGYGAGGGFKLQLTEADGQEAVAEDKNNSAMDIRRNLEAGGSEDGTEKEAHSN